MQFDLESIIKTLGYAGVFGIVFAESGLFFGFFLPGDSLLFTAGFLASQGFFYIKIESYNKAANAFKKAMELGPPGTGMNAYYYAKCLEKIGNEPDAIHYLYESAKLDNHALSPWLDLLEHYSNKKQLEKTREIATYIYQTPDLKEQLEEHEITTIQMLIQ